MSDVVELVTERFLNMLRVGGMSDGVGSTCLDKLRPADVSAALGMIEDERFRLALEVRAGLGDERESMRLRQLIRENIKLFAFAGDLNMRSSKARLKLDRISLCAIERLQGVVKKKGDKAACLDIHRDNYRKTWEPREEEIFKILLQWSINGDNALNSILSERYKVA